MKNYNIGIVGQGFVGTAIKEGLKDYYDLLTFDLDESKSNSTLENIADSCEIIFICLPTPMRKDGSCDTRIVASTIRKIESIETRNNPILVLKSTIPPGTTDDLQKLTRFDLCFSPEFLTEANSINDFRNQNRIIIGGPRPSTGTIKRMFSKVFPDIPIIKTGTRTAEMIKYFTNCFLATKVIFANQMYDICQASGVDYDKVCEYALYDKRIGKTHLLVPGPDGDRAFGGHCFPKDLEAIIAFSKEKEVNIDFFESVKNTNNRLRTNRDWEIMKGRAVSDD